jgi:opacity protein-like surface antigen
MAGPEEESMRRRRLCVLLSALCFLAAASVARAQGSPGVHFGIAGGAAFPTGDAGDLYDTGYHGSAMINFNAPLAPVGLRIEGMYARMNEKSQFGGGGHVQLGSGTANIVLGPRAIAFRPYFIGGGGFYRIKFTASGTVGGFEETQDKFGWNAGGGMSFGVGPVASIFIEARYIRVETDPNFALGTHFTFIPVTIGFVF